MKQLLCCVVALLLFAAIGTFWVTGTPQYSLYRFRQAVARHDAETARRYLDVDGVVDGMIDGTGDAGNRPPGEHSWQRLGESLADGFMTLMAPVMRESLRKQLRAALSHPEKDTTVIRKINATRLRDFEVRRDGDTALVTLRDDERVVFRMRKSGGSWRIVQFMMDSLVDYPPAKDSAS